MSPLLPVSCVSVSMNYDLLNFELLLENYLERTAIFIQCAVITKINRYNIIHKFLIEYTDSAKSQFLHNSHPYQQLQHQPFFHFILMIIK